MNKKMALQNYVFIEFNYAKRKKTVDGAVDLSEYIEGSYNTPILKN